MINYTTTIDSGKTIAEIQTLLSKRGVRKIVIDYDPDGNPSSLTFQLLVHGNPVAFTLPCRWQGVQQALKKLKVGSRYLSDKHCLNVSWRNVKTWVEAQCAMIDSQQVKIEEVFLPYAITKYGDTLYEHISSGNDQLLLN